MNPNMSSRIDRFNEEKSSTIDSTVGLKKANNCRVNALKHRLSDAKWRMNLNNGFNALKAIIEPNGRINKRGKLIRLSRIDILKSTINFIIDKESHVTKLTNKCTNNLIFGNSLDQIKNIFDLMEKGHQLNHSNNSKTDDNQISFVDSSANHEMDSLSNNYNKIEMLAKIALNMNSIEDNYEEMGQVKGSVTECSQSRRDDNNNQLYCSPNPEFIKQCYQTYCVKMPEESNSFKSYLNHRIERKDCLTTDLVEYLSTNIPLTTMSSLTYLTDSSFDSSSAGSHCDDFHYHLTSVNRIEDLNESMNRKKKSFSLSTESRPIKCRRKLDWSDSTSNDWPGIMNLMVDEKGSGDVLNVKDVKTESKQELIQAIEDRCTGDVELSKDLESIEVKDLCISSLNIDQCLQSLDYKDDFQFIQPTTDQLGINHHFDRNQQINAVIGCNQVFNELIDEINETELLDFLSSSGKYIPVQSISQMYSGIIQTNDSEPIPQTFI